MQNHPCKDFLHKQPYQMCSKTVVDTSDVDIAFDSEGVSNYYKKYDYYFEMYGLKTVHQIKDLTK